MYRIEDQRQREAEKNKMEVVMRMIDDHYIHEHPLRLRAKDAPSRAGAGKGILDNNVCYGCRKPISGAEELVYECGVCKSFILHRSCAQLPKEMMHPVHDAYFSREHDPHALILLPKSPFQSGRTRCNICDKFFSGFTYHCSLCGFNLDVSCAQLPKEMMHPLHDAYSSGRHDPHPLILLPKSPYQAQIYMCHVCLQFISGFTYHCSLCGFNLDVHCASEHKGGVVVPPERLVETLKHESHPVALVLRHRPATFRCDACGLEDYQEQSYYCPSCPFWIHRSCASLPARAKSDGHDCDLTLAYAFPTSLPDADKYTFDCDICQQMIYRHYWIYYCGSCRYFVHLHCMNTKTPQQIDDDDWLDDANFEKKLLRVLLFDDLLRLPAIDISKELIGRFLLRKNSLRRIEAEIRHFGHEEHPLVLFHELPSDYDIQEDDEILCDACVEPIFPSSSSAAAAKVDPPRYYSCKECGYFLHLSCAKLPKRLQHAKHPHPLTLWCPQKFYHAFACFACRKHSSGFFYKCETCQGSFKLDIRCAAMPTIIEHSRHNHPLFFTYERSKPYLPDECKGCGELIRFGGRFVCESCHDFVLHWECAMLPDAVRHRWDSHPLPLRFPPYKHHPDEFICDICEYHMHPKHWMYHCSQCDNSFHPNCVPRLGFGWYRHIKYGRLLRLTSHPHPLKFVCKPTLRSQCNDCGKPFIHSGTAFECEDCNFCLCEDCIRRQTSE